MLFLLSRNHVIQNTHTIHVSQAVCTLLGLLVNTNTLEKQELTRESHGIGLVQSSQGQVLMFYISNDAKAHVSSQPAVSVVDAGIGW